MVISLWIHRALGLEYSYSDIAMQCDTKSIWTIDLVFAMHRCGVKVEFYSTANQCSSEHIGIPFYKDSFEMDRLRVNRLFKEASLMPKNIGVQDRALDFDDMCSRIANADQWAVILVNSIGLHCADGCHGLNPGSTGDSAVSDMRFAGHYIILLHFDKSKSQIVYCDPASSHSRCQVGAGLLRESHFCEGTDRDILMIDANQKVTMNSYYALPF